MVDELTENFEDVGIVRFVRSHKAGRLNIRIKPDGEIRVAVPMHITVEAARNFVISKKVWIQRSLNNVSEKKSNSIISPEKALSTHYHTFRFSGIDIGNVTARIEDGVVFISYPRDLNHENEKLQEALRYIFNEVLRKEAKFYLPKRVEELAQKFKFKYNDLRIKNVKSRWGSCSGSNNINLSLHVMNLPNNLIDHIILHELCHTVHKNHGPRFHRLLEKVSPAAKEEAKEIKKFGIFKV